MMRGTVGAWFDAVCSRRTGAVAVREGGREVSFGDLARWSEAVSRALEPSLRHTGRRVAVMLPNSAAFVAAFFGIARIGGVVAPLHPQYRAQELAYYLGDLDPAAVVTGPRLVDALAAPVSALARTPALLSLGAPPEVTVVRPGDGEGSALPAGDTPPLLQQYTSGSTGAPKRVVRTHGALDAELAALQGAFETREDDRFLGLAPFSHVNGLVRTMCSAMYAGATLYPVEEFRRREVLDLVTGERLTFLGAVPQVYAILGQTPLRGVVDLSSLRVAFSSSAPLLPADARAFHARYGVWVRQLYGATETGSISINRDPELEGRLDSVGTPIPGVRVEVVDAAGRPVPRGVEGELRIASPFAASGYVGNEPATRESFRDGWYYSGDLGTLDEAGHVRITGRLKLLINRGGFKVNPYEVEAAIKEHPKVAAVAVVGVPGAHGDDVVQAVIVPAAPCTADEILAHCRTRIADYKIPGRVEFRDSLPTSASGKVLRAKLAGGPP